MHLPVIVESVYSFAGSNITLDALFSFAHKHKLSHVALTDKTMHAAYKFLTRAQNEGFIPVLGLQIEYAVLEDTKFPLVLYAQNKDGYKNLLKIASIQSVSGSITYATLKAHGNGLSVLFKQHDHISGDLFVSQNANSVNPVIEDIKALGIQVYMDHGIAYENAPSISINAARYLEDDDSVVYDVLCDILSVNKQKDAQSLMTSLQNGTSSFFDAHGLNFEIDKATLPKYDTPKQTSSARYLRALAIKGLEKRLNKPFKNTGDYLVRLEKELKTIHELGFDDYFLIVWDIVKFAKQEGMLVGPGRGSAPGSLVAYALGITAIDPIEHGLLFERFLNAARQTMPDIDIDFPDDKRDQVVRYLKSRYGQEYVALICTFGTFLKKSALRDSARVLNIEQKRIEQFAKQIEKYDSIEAMLYNDADVQNRAQTDVNIGKWLNAAKKIEGLPRHVSTHAAGVMISQEPLIEHTALQVGLNTLYQTQYEQKDLEAMGLLKMDVLGLRNLSLIESVIARIDAKHNQQIDVEKLPLDDQKTFRFLREKSTTGLFQLESSGMRRLIKELQIQSFDDIAVALALYRPGPMESIPQFLKRRRSQQSFDPIAREISDILKSTHGIVLYQEQIMAIATKFAGYSLNEADILRRAVSKKDRDILNAERKNFINNALKQGKSKEKANEIYDYIVKFADYGFNKSHSVAYGLIAYWMAYLKSHYPGIFLTVLMDSAKGSAQQMRMYMQELAEHHLTLRGPSVKKSKDTFHNIDGVIHYPLTGIKYLGNSVVKAFMSIRNQAMFNDFATFVFKTRQVFNAQHYAYLIDSGALDMFEYNKRTMKENIKPLLNVIDYDKAVPLDEFVFDIYEEYDEKTLRFLEEKSLGFNITHDIFAPYEQIAKKARLYWPSQIKEFSPKSLVSVIGLLSRVKEIQTKKGDAMAFLTIEDRLNPLDAVMFPSVYTQFKDALQEGVMVKCEGKIELRNAKRQLIIEKLAEVSVS